MALEVFGREYVCLSVIRNPHLPPLSLSSLGKEDAEGRAVLPPSSRASGTQGGAGFCSFGYTQSERASAEASSARSKSVSATRRTLLTERS